MTTRAESTRLACMTHNNRVLPTISANEAVLALTV
jgi:hypothetical protein